MAINEYDVGDEVKITGTFTVGGTATDPTTVTCKIRNPARTVTTYVYGTDAQLVKASTGVYYVLVDAALSGTYNYRFAGTGAAKAAEESAFHVVDSLFD